MILIVHAHPYPQHSRAGKALLGAVRGLPDVVVRDLYELYPDFYVDVAAEQAALAAAKTIVWQHPMYWYHAPALMVLWLEKVLALDWAYGARHALDGKRVMWVTTTGGPEDAYTRHPTRLSLEELAAPLRQTVDFCQMTWLPPLAVHHAGTLSNDQLLIAAESYRDRLVAERRHLMRDGASMHDGNVLMTMVVFLAAMVIAVPVFRKVGLGAVLGYLVAGVVVGPNAMGAVQITGAVHHFAELGVVLMLFTIGLELDLKKLWGMRRAVFGLGSLQLAVCGVVLAGAMAALGFAPAGAIVIGLTLALSSTAVAIQLMNDRHIMGTAVGEAVFGVLLFQDIAAIPLLIVVSVVYPSEGLVAFQALPALGAIAGIVLASRTVLNPALRWIATNGSRELFVAFALLLVVAVMQLMIAVGVSAGLGAFLAGVLLASSEFRHELEADLAPFKGLFLGLFFMTIGAGIDLPLLAAEWPRIVALLAGFFVAKAAMLMLVGRLVGQSLRERLSFTVLLGQGGEFGFVVVSLAVAGQMMSADAAAWINIVIALSIAASPLLMKLHDGALARYFVKPSTREPDRAMDYSQVIIAGFGRYGQIVGRLLVSQGIATTVMDHDSETIDNMRRFGFKVYYGDASRADLLEVAGAHHARVLVVAVDNAAAVTEICRVAQRHFPKLTIVARARDVVHLYELRKLGVHHVQRELFESSLVTGRAVLERLGVGRYEAREMADRFRATNIDMLMKMAGRREQVDAKVFASEARESREELERQLTTIAAQPKAGQDWHEERERLHQERAAADLD